jgi:hypothetical protein
MAICDGCRLLSSGGMTFREAPFRTGEREIPETDTEAPENAGAPDKQL